MKKVERFYYQPDFLNNITTWSWTMLILVIGIIFWLEVTTFNWITAAFFAAFIMILSIQTVSRTIEVIGSELIINKVIKSNFTVLNINNIKNVKKGRFSLSFEYEHKNYKVLMSHRTVEKIFGILTEG